jgi:glycosyltransferase involved in cell wall biosynthesis
MIAVNTAWNIYNFRAGLVKSLIDRGYEVIAVAPEDEYVPRLEALGCRFIPIAIDSKGTNPGSDLLLMCRFLRLFKRERPDVFLGYTVKPNVFGSMAAHMLGIPVINNISGLGAVFIQDGFLAKIVRKLYRAALCASRKVFFQNDDDHQYFLDSGLICSEVTDRLPGSGVNIENFAMTPPSGTERLNGKAFRFLLIGRMLWDKGVGEYVEAARSLRQRFPGVEVCLLGFVDVQNPAAISRAQIDAWVGEGIVSYLGVSDDVRQEIEKADCVVLPSYREGTPRTLLEAAAMGKPIVTTDAVGCREVVDHGHNGFLCKVRDAADLAEKMEEMLGLPHEARIQMGRNGRTKIEEQFDERIVIGKYHDAIDEILDYVD